MKTPRRPVISVAIATRNYGRFLARALDSVFRCHNPTDAPVQVVVADDGSTDNTRAVLTQYRRRYPENLEVVSIRTPAGISAVKNAALDRCIGQTVALLDADDEFMPDKLVHCHAALERGDVDLVTHDFYHQETEGALIPRTRSTWPYWWWPPSTWVFRNGAVRFNPHLTNMGDVEWMERHWGSLRTRHLERLLGVQHLHGRNDGLTRLDCQVPGYQAVGRIQGCPSADDRLAPGVWACRACGNQYLLPARCCGRDAVARPLYFHSHVLSPHAAPRPEFSLVILTRDGLALTRRAVDSFLARLPAGRRQEVEMVIVDGCSTDGTIEYVRALAESHPVKLIVTHPAEPFNYGRACNRGARAATGRFLLLLNNDIELCSDEPWEPLRRAFEDPCVGVVGASTVWSPAQRDPLCLDGARQYRFVNRPLTGYFWGVRRELYWELGGVDEAFAGHGYDELDFQYRALLAHYRLALVPIRIQHAGHATYEPVFGATNMKQMAAKNQRIFERKHGRWIYMQGARVEPFASHQAAWLSIVVVVGNEGPRLRQTLAGAAADPGCRDGSVQLIVLDNASSDETALLLEEYRLRLPSCLTVITLEEPVTPARARQIGRARAIGTTVRTLVPGDWQPTAIAPGG